MDDNKRTPDVLSYVLGITATAVLAVYVAGYFALPYVGSFGRSKERYYNANWLVSVYRPMAAIESVFVGQKVRVYRDVCGTGRIASHMYKESQRLKRGK